jgi:tetratricopeptide (TPR) repeat protein
MKAGLAILGGVFLFMQASFDAVASDDFAAGNRAYAAGNYADARQAYERALADGLHANALYNLGNTFFRLGEPGRAVLHYERALALRPRHPDATANLKVAREKTGAHVGGDAWWHRGLLWLPAGAATALALGGCWFFLLLGASAAWRRKGAFGVFAAAIGALAAAGYAAGIHWVQQEQEKVAIVVAEHADARSEPAERASVAEILPAGSRVSVLGEHGAWNYCRLPGGKRGWLPAATIESVVPRSKPAAGKS